MKINLLLFFLFCLSIAYSQNTDLVNKSYKERFIDIRDLQDSFLYKEKDSTTVFNEIAVLISSAKKAGDLELKLEAELLKANYLFNNYPEKQDEIQKWLDKILNQAEVNQNRFIKIKTHHLLGHFNWYIVRNYEIAFKNYLKMGNLLEDVSNNEMPDKVRFYNTIGYAYFDFLDYENAIYYLKKAIEIPRNGFTSFHINGSLNKLGLIYQRLENLDKSDDYFNAILNDTTTYRLDIWKGIASGNLGHNFFLRGCFEEAEPLMLFDIKKALENNDYRLASGSAIKLAEIYLTQKRNSESLEMLQNAESYIRRSNAYDRNKDFFSVYSKWHIENNNRELAKIYFDSTFQAIELFNTKYSGQNILRANQMVEESLRELQVEKAKLENQKMIIKRNILIYSLGFFCVFLFVFYLFQKRKFLYERFIQSQKLKHSNNELELARLELSNFKNKIKEKNQLIFNKNAENKNGLNQAEFDELKKSVILTNEDWSRFKSIFEKTHPGFQSAMESKYPDLSPSETRFLYLVKLNFSNKDMAAALGISPESLRVTWYRIRKKLGLDQKIKAKKLVSNLP